MGMLEFARMVLITPVELFPAIVIFLMYPSAKASSFKSMNSYINVCFDTEIGLLARFSNATLSTLSWYNIFKNLNVNNLFP